MQLFRILQSQGFGPRRACRELVESGRVAVDGVLADVIWVVPATPEGRRWIDERRARRNTMIDYLDFDPAAPMLPADYLFTPDQTAGAESTKGSGR